MIRLMRRLLRLEPRGTMMLGRGMIVLGMPWGTTEDLKLRVHRRVEQWATEGQRGVLSFPWPVDVDDRR